MARKEKARKEKDKDRDAKKESATPGRLIALEGTRGPDVTDGAARLLRQVRGKAGGGISRWDASGMFYEIRLGKSKLVTPSPRTLLLLYAADLAFRLRWQIRPALKEGKSVVAAPYLESAVAFGAAAGFSRQWMNELFGFAPKPEACYRVKEKKKRSGWKGKPTEGYLEFCATALKTVSPSWDAAELRRKMITYLQDLERRRGCQKLTKKAH